jgi:hypothetical protein
MVATEVAVHGLAWAVDEFKNDEPTRSDTIAPVAALSFISVFIYRFSSVVTGAITIHRDRLTVAV